LNGLLKDQSAQPVDTSPYGLSRTILFFWTLIVFLSYLFIGIADDNLSTFGSGVLILMGIAVGTTTAGKAIDSSQSSTLPPLSRMAGKGQ